MLFINQALCEGISHLIMSNSFATPWTVAHHAPLSMEFSRPAYWSRQPLPSPEDLPDPGIEPGSPTLAGGFLLSEPQGSPNQTLVSYSAVGLLQL